MDTTKVTMVELEDMQDMVRCCIGDIEFIVKKLNTALDTEKPLMFRIEVQEAKRLRDSAFSTFDHLQEILKNSKINP